MDTQRFYDYVTTFLLALVPIILIFQSYITQVVPASVLIVATLILAILSQYAGNRRVKDAVETVKTWKWVHYGLTILMALLPIITTYQVDILGAIPSGLVVPATLLLGFATQYASGERVEQANSQPIEEPPVQPEAEPEVIPDEKQPETPVEEEDGVA